MNVVIPAAGLGTRLLPHTLHRPKPLLHVGGATMLDHVLDRLAGIEVTNLVLVIGHLGEQIVAHMQRRGDFPTRFVAQSELLGQAHALALARRWLDGPTLVVFPDMVFELDRAVLDDARSDGVVFAHRVADPRRFGVVVTGPDGCAAQFVEKPDIAGPADAVVGVYYVKCGALLAVALDAVLSAGRTLGGEYYLAKALQQLVDGGARLSVRRMAGWRDCGTLPDLLRANRYLLERIAHDVPPNVDAVNAIVPPVRIAADARIVGSTIGPFVHVGPGCRLTGSVVGPHVSLAGANDLTQSIVRDTIVDVGASLVSAHVSAGVLGRRATVRGPHDGLNLGDDAVAAAAD